MEGFSIVITVLFSLLTDAARQQLTVCHKQSTSLCTHGRAC